MEILHSRKGDSHPHSSQASIVCIDTREVAKQMPSEVVHIPSTIPSRHQV
jgi:hypothetical protein